MLKKWMYKYIINYYKIIMLSIGNIRIFILCLKTNQEKLKSEIFQPVWYLTFEICQTL